MKKTSLQASGFILLFLTIVGSSPLKAQCDSSYVSQFLQAGQWLGNYLFGSVEISEEREGEIGDEIFGYLQTNFDLVENDTRLDKLEKILNRLKPYVQRTDIPYKIHLIEDAEMINAFSIAGGHIFVTTAIMEWVESDDELAFVIGHEIGHIDLGHCVRNVKKSMAIQSWADYMEVGEYAGMIEEVQTILGTPFGQPDEYSSDQYGATIASKAGYDPTRGEDFFRKLSKQENRNDIPYDLDIWMRTHPYSDQRKHCLHHFIERDLKD